MYNSLVEPKTLKQKASAFHRWRKRRLDNEQ